MRSLIRGPFFLWRRRSQAMMFPCALLENLQNNTRHVDEQCGRHQVEDANSGYKTLCALDITCHFEDWKESHRAEEVEDDDDEVSATKENHARLGEDDLNDTLEYISGDVEIPNVVSQSENEPKLMNPVLHE